MVQADVILPLRAETKKRDQISMGPAMAFIEEDTFVDFAPAPALHVISILLSLISIAYQICDRIRSRKSKRVRYKYRYSSEQLLMVLSAQ